MDTHDSRHKYIDTRGSGGTCMNTDMVLGVHVWTHMVGWYMYGHTHGCGYMYGHPW